MSGAPTPGPTLKWGPDNMAIEFTDVRKSFQESNGNEFVVLDDVNFSIEEGSFTCIMGPSGCGKTTLLNIVAGLETMDSGMIRRNGSEISQEDIPYAYVFQDPRLLNWLTVADNIKFALKSQGVPKSEHDERVRKYLEMVDLDGEESAYPLSLSGGMRQRVGVARALAVESDVVLMDEPFSALDEITARELRADVIDLWQQTGKTILFITHNISEAVFLSDKVLFMDNDGAIFSQPEIDVSRPRDPDDPRLLQLESKLMNEFFNRIEGPYSHG